MIALSYVENVAAALVLAATAGPHVDGQTYNVSNGEPRSVASILHTIVAELALNVRFVPVPFRIAYLPPLRRKHWPLSGRAGPSPLTRYGVGVLGRSCTLSIAPAQRDLGYTPHVSLDEGIRRTIPRGGAPHMRETHSAKLRAPAQPRRLEATYSIRCLKTCVCSLPAPAFIRRQ